MADFLMEIAGHTAAVHSLFDSTPYYFTSYFSKKEPEFSITVTAEDLIFEQKDADLEAAEEGFRPRVFSDPFLERATVQRQFAEFLISRDIVPVHGSAVAINGKAYLFTARSGTGKSTHTRLWRECFGARATMVNDDKPFLELSPAGIIAHGSPWSGKHGLDSNVSLPLQGICLLERGAENVIRRAEPEQLRELLKGFRPRTEAQAHRYADALTGLLSGVPLWHMFCNREQEAAKIAYQAMSE